MIAIAMVLLILAVRDVPLLNDRNMSLMAFAVFRALDVRHSVQQAQEGRSPPRASGRHSLRPDEPFFVPASMADLGL